jgi:hypothetical protein
MVQPEESQKFCVLPPIAPIRCIHSGCFTRRITGLLEARSAERTLLSDPWTACKPFRQRASSASMTTPADAGLSNGGPNVTTLRRTIRPGAGLTVALLAATLLAGCSGNLAPTPESTDASTPAASPGETDGASAGEQSVAEACDAILAGLQKLGGIDATTLQDDLTNDPEAAEATLEEAQAAIVDATDEVDNAEIRPYADRAAEATRGFFDAAREAAEDPANADPESVQDELATFAAALAELQTACVGD